MKSTVTKQLMQPLPKICDEPGCWASPTHEVRDGGEPIGYYCRRHANQIVRNGK